MLRPDTFNLPRNLIKINRKEIVVVSGLLDSNATHRTFVKRSGREKDQNHVLEGGGEGRIVLKFKFPKRKVNIRVTYLGVWRTV